MNFSRVKLLFIIPIIFSQTLADFGIDRYILVMLVMMEKPWSSMRLVLCTLWIDWPELSRAAARIVVFSL